MTAALAAHTGARGNEAVGWNRLTYLDLHKTMLWGKMYTSIVLMDDSLLSYPMVSYILDK